MKNVPPLPEEEHLPPASTFQYKVAFNYVSTYGRQFWQKEGDSWSTSLETFLIQNQDVKLATEQVTAGATTAEEKLHKIYAFVMSLENTAFSRVRTQGENKTDGRKEVKTAGDVLALKRGTPNQLAAVFVVMARAAGLSAYMMFVPDHRIEVFTESWLSLQQLDDYIAIVNLHDNDVFFDPGSRYCAYGHLAWQHTLVRGLRQTAYGTAIAATPTEALKTNTTSRIADLQLQPDGEISGTVKIVFRGLAALQLRQFWLENDEAELRKVLQHDAESDTPEGVHLEVQDVRHLLEYEEPLEVSMSLQGTIGASTGKRLILPADLLTSRVKGVFHPLTRQEPIAFHYAQQVEDTVTVHLPAGMALEGAPEEAVARIPSRAAFSMKVKSSVDSFVTQRVMARGFTRASVDDYPAIRTFYQQEEIANRSTVSVTKN